MNITDKVSTLQNFAPRSRYNFDFMVAIVLSYSQTGFQSKYHNTRRRIKKHMGTNYKSMVRDNELLN